MNKIFIKIESMKIRVNVMVCTFKLFELLQLNEFYNIEKMQSNVTWNTE